MRGSNRKGLTGLAAGLLLLLVAGCLRLPDGDGSASAGIEPASWAERAGRRLYDGAPPVIPHDRLGASCVSCHVTLRPASAGLGIPPASPHGGTEGLSAGSRCTQCHVYQVTTDTFVDNDFASVRTGSPSGDRLYDGAPPVMPHRLHMREDCMACHAGPGARPEIATTHPERTRCRQCHVEATETGEFASARGPSTISE